jgi:hypothetical protein
VGFLSDLIEPAVCLCGAARWTKQNRVLLRVASATKGLFGSRSSGAWLVSESLAHLRQSECMQHVVFD